MLMFAISLTGWGVSMAQGQANPLDRDALQQSVYANRGLKDSFIANKWFIAYVLALLFLFLWFAYTYM